MIKTLIIATLIGIIISLGHALFSMTSGPTDNKRMVQALTWRIALSVGLFILLLAGWYVGALTPHGIGG